MELILPAAEVVSEYLDLAIDSIWYTLGREGTDFTTCDRAVSAIKNLQKEVESHWDKIPPTEQKFEVYEWIYLHGILYFSKLDAVDVSGIISNAPRLLSCVKPTDLECV